MCWICKWICKWRRAEEFRRTWGSAIESCRRRSKFRTARKWRIWRWPDVCRVPGWGCGCVRRRRRRRRRRRMGRWCAWGRRTATFATSRLKPSWFRKWRNRPNCGGCDGFRRRKFWADRRRCAATNFWRFRPDLWRPERKFRCCWCCWRSRGCGWSLRVRSVRQSGSYPVRRLHPLRPECSGRPFCRRRRRASFRTSGSCRALPARCNVLGRLRGRRSRSFRPTRRMKIRQRTFRSPSRCSSRWPRTRGSRRRWNGARNWNVRSFRRCGCAGTATDSIGTSAASCLIRRTGHCRSSPALFESKLVLINLIA